MYTRMDAVRTAFYYSGKTKCMYVSLGSWLYNCGTSFVRRVAHTKTHTFTRAINKMIW